MVNVVHELPLFGGFCLSSWKQVCTFPCTAPVAGAGGGGSTATVCIFLPSVARCVGRSQADGMIPGQVGAAAAVLCGPRHPLSLPCCRSLNHQESLVELSLLPDATGKQDVLSAPLGQPPPKQDGRTKQQKRTATFFQLNKSVSELFLQHVIFPSKMEGQVHRDTLFKRQVGL